MAQLFQIEQTGHLLSTQQTTQKQPQNFCQSTSVQEATSLFSQNIGRSLKSIQPNQPKAKIIRFDQLKLPNELNQIIAQIAQHDFSYLFSMYIVITIIQKLILWKDMVQYVVRQDVKRFLDLISAKIAFMPYSHIIYKDLLQATKKLETAYEYSGNKRNPTYQQHQTDRIFKEFIQQLEKKPRRQSRFHIVGIDKNKFQIGEYMPKVSEFFKDRKWREIMLITKQYIQTANLEDQKPDNPEIIKIRRKMELNQTICRHKLMNVSCLGCLNFFIKNWNFFDQSVNKIKFALGGSALNLIHDYNNKNGEQIAMLKREITGLLNYRGGAILYGCQQKYLDVVAKGQYLVKSQAQKFVQIVSQIVEQIKPSPKMNQNIIITFVPVLKDLVTESTINLLQQRDQFENQFEGLYAARIVVRPTIKQTYYYQENQKTMQSIRYKSLFNDQQSIVIKQIEMNNQSQSQNNIHDQNICQDWISELVFGVETDFDHESCQIPSHGANIPQMMYDKKEKSILLEVEDIQKKFTYASGVVVKPQYFQELKRKLKKYNFQHFVEMPFPNSKIKGANVTAILYHNLSHSQIKQIISANNDFQFDGRSTISAAISDHVKLVNRVNKNALPAEQLNNLQLWIDDEFKEDKCRINIIAVKNEFKENQYYLKVAGNKSVKKCTLFTYLLTNHFNEKSLLKNPKSLE